MMILRSRLSLAWPKGTSDMASARLWMMPCGLQAPLLQPAASCWSLVCMIYLCVCWFGWEFAAPMSVSCQPSGDCPRHL